MAGREGLELVVELILLTLGNVYGISDTKILQVIDYVSLLTLFCTWAANLLHRRFSMVPSPQTTESVHQTGGGVKRPNAKCQIAH